MTLLTILFSSGLIFLEGSSIHSVSQQKRHVQITRIFKMKTRVTTKDHIRIGIKYGIIFSINQNGPPFTTWNQKKTRKYCHNVIKKITEIHLKQNFQKLKITQRRLFRWFWKHNRNYHKIKKQLDKKAIRLKRAFIRNIKLPAIMEKILYKYTILEQTKMQLKYKKYTLNHVKKFSELKKKYNYHKKNILRIQKQIKELTAFIKKHDTYGITPIGYRKN